jgi:hypothetical protein
MSQLFLKRASASRSSGQWRDDDYDVLESGDGVGRIFFPDAVGPLRLLALRHAASVHQRCATSSWTLMM